MDNLSANANDVIEILLDRVKEQERTIAILQANLTELVKKNKENQDKPTEETAKDPQ